MGPYLVLLALAALGLALGWRLTPAPTERSDTHGLARLLQLVIAATGLLALVLVLVPIVARVGAIACTTEAEQAGECLVGVHERGLFGGAAFALLVGAAFAFVVRKGVLDFPLATAIARKDGEPAREDQRAEIEAATKQLDEEPPPADEAETAEKPAPVDKPKPVDQPGPAEQPETEAEQATRAEQAEEPEPASHRRLEGPVFRAFVDDQTVDLEVAIQTAAERLRSERVAVVFSRGASKDANEALLKLAEAFNAYHYVLEGTAAATEGLPTGDTPDPHVADEIAGPDAQHAMQLALDLAGNLIETVFLLDTRVAFPAYVLGRLTVLQSVCIAHAHDDVSAACQVVLPGTNPGEREGELIDSGGGVNLRRPRAWLVERIIEALREQEAEGPGDGPESDDETSGES